MSGLGADTAASSGGSGSYEEEEDDVPYEVERVVSHRERGNTLQYLIKWKGFRSSSNTWEPQGNLNCLELINAYWDAKQQRPAPVVRPSAGGPAIVVGASRTARGFVYRVRMQDGQTFIASSAFMRAKFPRMLVEFFEAHRQPDDAPDDAPDGHATA
jgi:hypothetical protein